MTTKKKKLTRQYGGVDAVQRQQERREKFIDAGLEAFGTLGYVRSTIKGICQLAGLTERYFYESYQSKEDLLCAVYRRLTSELESDALAIIETPGISTRDIAFNALKMFYMHFYNDPRRARIQLFEVLGVSPRIDVEYQSAMRTLADWIVLAGAAAFPDIDREWMRQSVIPTGTAGAVIEIANQWVLDGFVRPVDEIVSQAIEVFSIVGLYYNKKNLQSNR